MRGKLCSWSKYDWHVYPKTHKEKNSTLIVFIKKECALFCYHCFLSFLTKCMHDFEKMGYSEKEISDWISHIKWVKPNEEVSKEFDKDLLDNIEGME